MGHFNYILNNSPVAFVHEGASFSSAYNRQIEFLIEGPHKYKGISDQQSLPNLTSSSVDKINVLTYIAHVRALLDRDGDEFLIEIITEILLSDHIVYIHFLCV